MLTVSTNAALEIVAEPDSTCCPASTRSPTMSTGTQPEAQPRPERRPCKCLEPSWRKGLHAEKACQSIPNDTISAIQKELERVWPSKKPFRVSLCPDGQDGDNFGRSWPLYRVKCLDALRDDVLVVGEYANTIRLAYDSVLHILQSLAERHEAFSPIRAITADRHPSFFGQICSACDGVRISQRGPSQVQGSAYKK